MALIITIYSSWSSFACNYYGFVITNHICVAHARNIAVQNVTDA